MDVEDQKKILRGVSSQKAGEAMDSEVEEGTIEALDENDDGIVDLEDGSVEVTISDADAEIPSDGEHFDNLAEILPIEDVVAVGRDLLDLIEDDIEDRKKRDEAYAEGLARTGMGSDAPGGADFEGANTVTHPMMVKAAVDFSARVMKEIFPPAGPAKQYIYGTPTKDKVDKAKRKTAHMNWQITEEMPEFRPELEQLLTQVPIAGVQYLKLRWDPQKKRNVPEAVYVDNVFVPASASSYLTAQRKTIREHITEKTFQDRVLSGLYIDASLTGASLPEISESATVNESIEGKESSSYNSDGLRCIYECYCFLDLEAEDDFKPYVVTIDEATSTVLSIYRNWLEDDEGCEELKHMVEFPCIPWRGAYPVGLIHLIGGLSAAATGALRALLDSAHISNVPAGIRLANGGGSGGQNKMPAPGTFVEIEGAINCDDIRKVVMPVPFNQPSPVLFQLLGFLVEAGENVVQTTFADMAKQRNDMPVGTTLALIEQGMTVFSSIHARMHAAMKQVLEILHRNNKLYLTEKQVMTETGELMVRRADYDGPMDVVPVSDPNIFSEAQRMAQVQAVVMRSDTHPGLYDARAVEEFLLERMKIPNAKELLTPRPAPQHLNAVNENAAATMGRPVVAFPEQDHLSHIATHVGYIQYILSQPGIGQLVGKAAGPMLLNHIKEHIALWYVTQVYEMTSAAAGMPIDQLIDIKDDELTQQFDKVMAIASDQALSMAPTAFGNAPKIIQEAIKFMQQFQPPPPLDPSQVAAQEVQRKQGADVQKMQIEQAKLANDQQQQALAAQREERIAASEGQQAEREAANEDANRQAQLVQETMQQTGEDQRKQLEVEARHQMNVEDNQTALTIASAEIATGENSNLSTGTGINPSP